MKATMRVLAMALVSACVAVAEPLGANERCSASLEGAKGDGCPERGGAEAQVLHLKEGQSARHGPAWGAGLIEQVIEVDVLVS
jgi:hypothetical protein